MNKEFPFGIIPSRRSEILAILRNHRLSCIPIVTENENKLKGTISLSDIAKNPDENQIAMLMNRDAKTVGENDDLKKLVRILIENNVTIVPVIDNDKKLKGTVTVWDVVSKSKQIHQLKEPIFEYTKFDITAIYSETPLTTAWEIMRLSKLIALPVLNSHGHLEGMIDDSDLMGVSEIVQHRELEVNIGSEDAWAWQTSDFLYIVKKTLQLPDKAVKDIMTKDVVTISKNATLAEAAAKMKEHNVEHIPVVDAIGTVLGVIRDYDILKAFIKHLGK